MRYPMTMSIIAVQLEAEDEVTAYVSFNRGEDGRNAFRHELTLDKVSDATDPTMWAQMVTARVCDAL